MAHPIDELMKEALGITDEQMAALEKHTKPLRDFKAKMNTPKNKAARTLNLITEAICNFAHNEQFKEIPQDLQEMFEELHKRLHAFDPVKEMGMPKQEDVDKEIEQIATGMADGLMNDPILKNLPGKSRGIGGLRQLTSVDGELDAFLRQR